ncbi:hypothetical protein [Nitratireductor alexandrii]|nr:hypothetical protein [Nitratireductor alexandrii]
MQKLYETWRAADPIKRFEVGLASVRTTVGVAMLLFVVATWLYAQ